MGDIASAFAGLALGYWIRYESPVREIAIVEVENATFGTYLPLILVGVVLLAITFSYLNLYDERWLLRRLRSLGLIIKGTTFWLFAYLGLSLALKFDPPISRLFVLVAYVTTLLSLYCWRSVFYRIVSRSHFRNRLQLRVAVLGHSKKAEQFAEEIDQPGLHTFGMVGFVDMGDTERIPEGWKGMNLWGADNLESILVENRIDVLLAANVEMAREELISVTEICERNYIEWKVIPSVFDVFVSNLRLQTFGNVPVLGVDHFDILRLFNRIVKRSFDVLVAVIGLVLTGPLIGLLAILIRKESSGGVVFKQERIGTNHRPFVMYKLRSMRMNSAEEDEQSQSTALGDPRLLRVGRLIRKWNLDELPQFINVLKGEMSIVGPRPERSYHVDRLSKVIPHYMPRHLVKPGMTGWAQANRLRGEGDLEKRIQYDIYYIENWSLWFDIQIVLLTFMRWKDDS